MESDHYPSAIEWDSLFLVNLINGISRSLGEVDLIVLCIKELLAHCNFPVVSFIPRSSNSIAHVFATFFVSLDLDSHPLYSDPLVSDQSLI